jgi:RNA polymerase sigma-70 factor, ECF subfamily
MPWLVAITKNECSRYWRRNTRLPALVELQHVAAHPHPLDWDRVLERVIVDQVLEDLPPQDQQLVRLRYSVGLSQREIATVMQMPEGTVKARLHRLRAKLRTQLLSTVVDETTRT